MSLRVLLSRPVPTVVSAVVAVVATHVGVATLSAQTGPETTPAIVAAADAASPAIAAGPVQPTWDSVRSHYTVPAWFTDAKFGIMMHWGLYAVPAHASEWYGKHMYGNPGITKWHTEHFGPPDKFGYKDFIPRFTADKFDPDAWAALFKKAGARYIVPTAVHHDGFALWDTALTRWNAKAMGPKRDLMGDLAQAVRKQGLKFGVSHHGIEHFTFIQPTKGLATDLHDSANADFYSVADRSDAAVQTFLTNWVAENVEIIDKYQPDMLWFDNGVNARLFDPLKLRVAAHYYNRAVEWGKQVSLSTKGHDSKAGPAYLAGSIMDFERRSRAPKALVDYAWQVDEPVLFRFGYTEGSPIAKPGSIIQLLVDCAAKNGSLLLNISPKADGTIPDDQQQLLLAIGAWLDVNGEAIYATRPWKIFGEGSGEQTIRFTTKGDTLYALALTWPSSGEMVIPALAAGTTHATGEIGSVTMLGDAEELEFTRDASGLKIKFPTAKPTEHASALKITGLSL